MNCRHALRLLSNHLEGRLSPREAGAVAAHLHACPACRRFRDDLVAMEGELAGPADPLPPPGIERQAIRLWHMEMRNADLGFGNGRRAPLIRNPKSTIHNPKFSRRSPLHVAVLVAAMLLAILALELPAAGGRHASQAPCLLTQGTV